MNQAMKRTMYILIVGAILLAACTAPAAAPTQDPAEAQRQIQEAVALTVAAQNAQATEQQSLLPEPTNTTLPTQTTAAPAATDIPLPTATPFVVVPPTAVPAVSSGGGGGTVVKPEYSCDVIRQRPYDNSYWKRNKDFDVRWTIVNTGTKAWRAGLDLKYSSGPNFTGSTLVQLPAMAPGDQYEVILDAVTPSDDGHYVMVWMLEGGFCFPYVAINVEQ